MFTVESFLTSIVPYVYVLIVEPVFISRSYEYLPNKALVWVAVIASVITPRLVKVMPDELVSVSATSLLIAFLISIVAVHPVKLIGVPDSVAVIVPGVQVSPCQIS